MSELDLRHLVQQTLEEIAGKKERQVQKAEMLVEGKPPPGLSKVGPARAKGERAPRKKHKRGYVVLWDDGKERNAAESWARLLHLNCKRNLTDEQLLGVMQTLYDGELKGFYANVRRVRNAYNNATLAGMDKYIPLVRSVRYVVRRGCVYTATARGWALRLVREGSPSV